ncbi:unnamed protein product (macronuclear) [Paramecium tetraurelia]|uniref:N-acetyltransferase domain-containing protein n=1 Tax=Paramecium tetraurelia TaxID=5888 RepID=A0CUL7_PARTE|nr:uncharacterized protein GSPATT00010684001 [Paramecium tetraurelia]CAK74484.1 unnamed protein product [Paramecium tetraurelia]|eukprot:XP_001441881.1 hypothetical protein (macronuclear) [Paramecium tetraurelia strain d4-2]
MEHQKSRQDNIVQPKSRHLIVMNQLKKKEENWNHRFYVSKQLKNESVEKFQPKLSQLQAKLIEVQNYYDIPEFHRQLFLMCLKTLPKINQAILFEIEEIQLKKSHIQQCMQAVESRERCLSALLKHIQLIENNPGDEQLISKSAELITHLRILSINVVEQIIGWRQYLMKFLVNIHSTESISLPYTYYKENYLIKMKKDVLYIQNSTLSNYYQFSKQSDPFFVAITRPATDLNKIVQFISKPLLKRIKNCELLIQEEASQMQKEDKSFYNQLNSRDQIKMTKPPKRSNLSQNQNRVLIKQLDPTDFTNQTSGSVSKINPQKQSTQSTKQAQENQFKQELIKISNEQIQKTQGRQQLQIPSVQQSADKRNKDSSLDQKNKDSSKINSPKSLTQVATQNENEIKILKCQLNDTLVENYLKDISDDFKKSWRGEIAQMLHQYQSQEESFCLGIYQNNKLVGFGQCFLDPSLQERKLMLSHFSTAEYSQFQEYLKMILQFIWDLDSCQEIRMSLYHYNQNDCFQANKEITTKLKELNFKWKVVQSVNSETRFTVMAIRRPAELKITKQYDPIFLQHLFYTTENTQTKNENQFFSLSGLTNLNTKVDFQDHQINSIKDILSASAYQFKGIKLQEQTRQAFHDYIYESFEHLNEINPYNNDIQQLQEQVISSFSKECYRWSKFKLANHNKLIYNSFRPESNIDHAKVFMSESGDIKVYIIATDQSNTSIFVFEYQEELNLQKVQSILIQCGMQVPIDQNLNIPQFTLNCKAQVQDNIMGVGRFSTAYRPKMMDIHNAEGLIIKPPFVFGIINEDFNELTNMPNLFFRVEEQHCLQL